ncbi:hypothetical protein Bca4012_008839 [Brassica carinata]
MASAPWKIQRTTTGSTSGSSEIPQGDINEGRDDLCDSEEDLQKALQEPEQVEVEGDHLSNIQDERDDHLSNLDQIMQGDTIDERDDMKYLLCDSEGDLQKALSKNLNRFKISSNMMIGGEVSTQTTQGEEFQMLNILKYHLNAPTLKKLVDACLRAITPLHNNLIPLCTYLTDLGMLDRDCTRYQITISAAVCLFLGQSIPESVVSGSAMLCASEKSPFCMISISTIVYLTVRLFVSNTRLL